MVIYSALAFAVFGNLEVDKVIEAKNYALAEALKPIFGALGFTIISITALFATSSSINAVLYATTNISYQLAKDGQLPGFFTKQLGYSREGLLVSLVITALLIIPGFIANSCFRLHYRIVYSRRNSFRPS